MPDSIKIIIALLLAGLTGCASVPIETQPAAIYKDGEAFYASKRYDDAIAQYRKVHDAYASTELSSSAELRIADAYFESERYIEASSEYTQFRKLHPTHAQAPYSLYRLGLSNYNQITGLDRDQTPQKNSVIFFEEFLSKYPKSEYFVDVTVKLEEVRHQQLQYEQYIARFYYRTEKYDSAIKRLEDALITFPKSTLHDETWYLLGACRIKSGSPDKARTAFNKLSTDFPESKYIYEASKLLEKHY
ncbi:MAG: outer membrane protein assembly factor BamD [Geobacteraceae bacterium]|nr:outer membrane protein assembly factor BamD [Geobacteraceae bacterium]